MVVTTATMIGVCSGMGVLIVVTIIASVTYFYRLGAFKDWPCCKFFKKKPPPPIMPPRRTDFGKTMNADEFEEYVQKLHANSDILFTEEYASLGPHNSDRTSQVASTEINVEKNRYVAVVPYDQTRVRLKSLHGKPGSNYINASYVDGFRRLHAYVATQAPLKKTIPDFWRMVWETKARVIVMVTNLVEKGRVKGEQYWSTCGNVEYEGFKVSTNWEKKYCHYITRQFTVTYHNLSDGTEESRTIWHYHYTAWPDHGVPDNGSTLLSFIIRCREHQRDIHSPTVVHCSAGVGRTGTFMVLDSQMRQYDHFQNVNIYMYLMKIRLQRNYLVQQECQYIFIHDALLEYIKAGGTRIFTDSLELNIATHYSTRAKMITSKIRAEWDLLSNINVHDNVVCAAKNPKNINKNRNVDVFSMDTNRVILPSRVAIEGSSYINANLVDGFLSRDAYIITQAPMNNTVNEFWRMNWEMQVCIVVSLLTDEEINDADNIGLYIPESLNTSITCGEFEIKLIQEVHFQNFYHRKHLILSDTTDNDADKEKLRHIYHYHFTKWPTNVRPPGNNLMTFVHDIITCQRDLPEVPRNCDVDNRPLVIHDLDGSGRAALLSMILHLTEQIQDAGPFIDVYSYVHNLMSRRVGCLTDINDYRFLYKVLFAIIKYVSKQSGSPDKEASADSQGPPEVLQNPDSIEK